MPLPDALFDVGLCQQGFQFFPDRAAALKELKRVLGPGGRILLSIWEGETPYSAAMAAAVETHVGREPASTLRTSRACPDPDTVRALMVQTGFRDVRTVARTITRRLPGIARFVLRHLAATPVASAIAALSEAGRAALGDDVREALLTYAEGDGIRYREVAHVVMAVR
jgi:SAM-dependent methyltransferase